MDMSAFIVAKSDQLNADDLLGGPRTITITGVRGTDASDQPVAVSYEGDAGKPFKPCKSMRRVMVHCWGKDAAKYAGRSMTIYCDPDVQFGGMKVGGIRISHMSHIDAKKSMALTATRGKKGLYTVHPLTDAPKKQGQGRAQPTATLTVEQARTHLEKTCPPGVTNPQALADLERAWAGIGAENRKALAAELDGFKHIARASLPPAAEPAADPDDVAFDAPQTTGGTYDGA